MVQHDQWSRLQSDNIKSMQMADKAYFKTRTMWHSQILQKKILLAENYLKFSYIGLMNQNMAVKK